MFWKKIRNKKELYAFGAILVLAAIFRFYRLDEYMQFLGDQGRDAIIVKQILVDHHLPAIGPPMSVGNVYLGPLYYYMMAVAMGIFWLNPVAAAGMCALLGVISVGLLYYLTREWFGDKAGLIAGLLYAYSPVAINYSRFSWNPNPVPFFTLLSFLGLYKAHKTGNSWWFILVGFGVAATIQMHYLSLILLPIIGLLWIYELSLVLRKKLVRRNFFGGSLLGLLTFLVTMSPLAFFDFRHGFLNYHGLMDLFFGGGSEVKLTLVDSMNRLPWVYANSLIGRYIAGENSLLTLIISLTILIPLIYGIYQKIEGQKLRWPILTLTVWLVVGFIGLMFYKRDIYDHYLAFVSPVPFILMGALFVLASEKLNKKMQIFWKIIFGVFLAVVLYFNFLENPILENPNRQLQKTQEIDQFIIQASAGKPFNFALLSKNNYDSAYQYYLDLYGHKPLPVPESKTDQLFVVCEDQDCKPVGNPKYEIAAFGWTQQEWQKEVAGQKVFKLVPNPAQGAR